jgi:hypothetical protein
MTLHRRVEIAGFLPEPAWHETQATPTYAAPDLVQLVKVPGPGTLIWWGIGMNGADETSVAVDGTAASFDAQFVMQIHADKGRSQTYIAFTPISVTLGGALPFGRVAIERDLPPGATGWLRMISLTAAGPATHLWLNYRFIPGAAVGV